MSKSLIRNVMGGQTFGFALPCTGEEAKSFADAHLEGEYSVFEVKSQSGNDTETNVNRVTICGKNSENKNKVTFSFYCKNEFNENEIRTALKGATFNSVKFDDIYILGLQPLVIGA